MLSKMAKPPTPIKYNYSYKEIAQKDLNKSKVLELKAYAKTLEIRVSGNKDELKQRIKSHINNTYLAIKIQSLIRRKLVYMWFALKGSTKDCVNDSDFYTLEPLDEIPLLYYMQYKGPTVNYGFNILSLCSLAVKHKKFDNPYTREHMQSNVMSKIIRLTNILFPNNELMNEIKNLYDGKDSSNALHGLMMPVVSTSLQRQNPLFMRLNSLPLEQRVTELFMAIDALGNYTQKEWLLQMEVSRIRYTIIKVYTIWQRIPAEQRAKVSPHVSPFNRQIMANMNGEQTRTEALECIVKMGEVLVHSATEREDRVMGAMYFLIGLTMASPDARLSLPWLHDSYYDILNRGN